MEVHTRHTPSSGVARLLLTGGESVRAEQAAMMASSFGMAVGRHPGRSGLRGQDNGAAVFTAPADGGWIDIAPPHPGDVYPLELDGQTGWCVAMDAVLAQAVTVRVTPRWPGLQALFGSDAGFLQHCGGSGPIVLCAVGAVDAFALQPGELMTMSPGHLLAYPDTMQCRLRALDPAAPQSLRTGEGLAFDFAGPGTVLARTRRPRAYD
ncbi:MAG: AIM24 family protein [Haloechinothrix sp.]